MSIFMLHGREISSSRISGLFSGRHYPPGHHEFGARRPNRSNQPRSAALVNGLMPCRSYLSCHKALAPAQLAVSLATGSRPVAWRVRGIGSPHDPTDTHQLVDQGDGGHVVPDASLKLHSPLLRTTQATGVDPVQLLRTRLVVRGAAGIEQHPTGGQLDHEFVELNPIEPVSSADPAGVTPMDLTEQRCRSTAHAARGCCDDAGPLARGKGA